MLCFIIYYVYAVLLSISTVPALGDCDDGEIGGMMIGRGN
jgi:hypothetical protein